MEEIEIELYATATGKRPFEIWIKEIKEIHTRAKILTRLDRLKLGNFGDCKTLQEGVCELRIHYGPGIRFITERLGKKSSCFFAVAIKAPKKGTSLKQRSI
jgi:putative addiction module killer protein